MACCAERAPACEVAPGEVTAYGGGQAGVGGHVVTEQVDHGVPAVAPDREWVRVRACGKARRGAAHLHCARRDTLVEQAAFDLHAARRRGGGLGQRASPVR